MKPFQNLFGALQGTAQRAEGLDATVLESDTDLDNYVDGSAVTTNRLYYAHAGNGITHKPEDVDAFGMLTRHIDGVHTGQLLVSAEKGFFYRSYDAGTRLWDEWKNISGQSSGWGEPIILDGPTDLDTLQGWNGCCVKQLSELLFILPLLICELWSAAGVSALPFAERHSIHRMGTTLSRRRFFTASPQYKIGQQNSRRSRPSASQRNSNTGRTLYEP